jgi:hypothetical protein
MDLNEHLLESDIIKNRALMQAIEEYRDRLFSSMRNNDPLPIAAMHTKTIGIENQHRRAGEILEAEIYRALAHATLRLHQTAQYNQTIANECTCFDELAITSCRCPYQSTNFEEENALLQEVLTGALAHDWQRKGVSAEEAAVAVALYNPFVLTNPIIR